MRELPFADEASPEAAVRRTVVWILCSPEFIYADLTPPDQAPSPHAIAARLALAMWDSLPDAELVAAADAGQLQTPEQVESQARRMLHDPRTRYKLRGFFQSLAGNRRSRFVEGRAAVSGFRRTCDRGSASVARVVLGAGRVEPFVGLSPAFVGRLLVAEPATSGHVRVARSGAWPPARPRHCGEALTATLRPNRNPSRIFSEPSSQGSSEPAC